MSITEAGRLGNNRDEFQDSCQGRHVLSKISRLEEDR